jgi:hypothetical protein
MNELSSEITETLADAQSRILEIEASSLDRGEKDKLIDQIVNDTEEKVKYLGLEGEKLLSQNAELNDLYGTSLATSFGDTVLGSLYDDVDSFDGLTTMATTALNDMGE